jgi:hypothetical protein
LVGAVVEREMTGVVGVEARKVVVLRVVGLIVMVFAVVVLLVMVVMVVMVMMRRR